MILDPESTPQRADDTKDTYQIFVIQSGVNGFAVREFVSHESIMNSFTNAPRSWYFTELQQALRFIEELFPCDR